jgi:hypothetical protein
VNAFPQIGQSKFLGHWFAFRRLERIWYIF